MYLVELAKGDDGFGCFLLHSEGSIYVVPVSRSAKDAGLLVGDVVMEIEAFDTWELHDNLHPSLIKEYEISHNVYNFSWRFRCGICDLSCSLEGGIKSNSSGPKPRVIQISEL